MLKTILKLNFATVAQLSFYTGLSLGALAGLLVAVPVGAACGVLMAPKPGHKSRKDVAQDALQFVDGIMVNGNALISKSRKIISVLNS